jgi:iron complex transport system substrate-binding protein
MTRRQLAAALALAALTACTRDGSGQRSNDAAPGERANQGPSDRPNEGAPGTSGKTLGEAHRVVSLSPATTEALFAVGGGDRMVGRSRFCDWPPEAMKLPALGGMVDADFEGIVGLGPDLLVGAPGPASTRLADKLSAFKVATWFPQTDSLAAVDAMILEAGERTGHAADARQVTATVDARLAEVEHAVAGDPSPRVLMVVDLNPVVATGPKDFLDELLRRAGGTNVLSTGVSWQTLDFEEITGLDPDVILDVSSMSGGGPTRITPAAHGWADVRAVREGHVIAITDVRVLRPGPRIAEGLAILAHALHPHSPVPSW